MTEYVLGFAFSNNRPVRRVLLIQKEKPTWMAGKINGIGGKIERGEAPLDAMAREFREECGIDTHPLLWRSFLVMKLPEATVHCFSAEHSFEGARSVTNEHVVVANVNELLTYQQGFPPCATFLNKDGVSHLHAEVSLMPNVPWLVAMALMGNIGGAPTLTF